MINHHTSVTLQRYNVTTLQRYNVVVGLRTLSRTGYVRYHVRNGVWLQLLIINQPRIVGDGFKILCDVSMLRYD